MAHSLSRRNFLTGMTCLAGASLSPALTQRARACWADIGLREDFGPSVEVFAAQRAKQLRLKFIPKSAAAGTLQVTNLTKQPLNVELPMGFAGTPVLAQFQPGGLQGQGQAQGQSVGVGFGQGNRNQNGNGNGNGNNFFMNIAPEKVGKLELELLCLEYGKPDPRPAMAYEIKPIEEYTPRAGVQEFVRAFAHGKFPHAAAQAAAWHLANDMSWAELAALRVKRYATVVTPEPPPVFTAKELTQAQEIVQHVQKSLRSAETSLSQG